MGAPRKVFFLTRMSSEKTISKICIGGAKFLEKTLAFWKTV